MGIEENEVSKNAHGGTELVKRGLAERIEKLEPGLLDNFQVICSRVRELHDDKIRVYWLHDLPEDPETNHLHDQNSRNRFHHMVFCGEWQYTRYRDYLGIGYSMDHSVIDNGITPFEWEPKSKEEVRLIYTSTPQRGLGILVPVFSALAEQNEVNLHLDVFSSFDIYGWKGGDDKFKELFDRCREHPQITYHGFKPNEIVRKYLNRAHIFSYPSVWMECNSVATMEAMSAGLIVVTPNYGGLVDTTGKLTMMYQGDDDPQVHANVFANALQMAISRVHKPEMETYTKYVKTYADTRFNWDTVTYQWINLLKKLVARYPDAESRRQANRPLVYNTGG
jgi:glycosyltransferase involved in cell wall biosynthesis